MIVEGLPSPESLLQPCEAGRTVFLPAGPRGPCGNDRSALVRLQGAVRPVELCSGHVEVLRQWLSAG